MHFQIDDKTHKLTKFQWQVLQVTSTIPMGEKRTYQWVAQQLGKPAAVRAVGQALRRNPYPLLIPCHRVVKSDGSLGGYEGGPSQRKKALLEVEQFILKNMNDLK